MALTYKTTPQTLADLLKPGLQQILENKYNDLVDSYVEQMRAELKSQVKPYVQKSIQAFYNQRDNYNEPEINVIVELAEKNT